MLEQLKLDFVFLSETYNQASLYIFTFLRNCLQSFKKYIGEYCKCRTEAFEIVNFSEEFDTTLWN